MNIKTSILYTLENSPRYEEAERHGDDEVDG
jgi:hypothetical protein